MKLKKIRNFCVISHINHGKSTLSDQFLNITQKWRHNKNKQLMDSMELEKERGITIKLNTAQINYKYNNEIYELNLIDTPGHVDFTYEVSRSLKACEGAILLIDAAKGIQAQTISHLKVAKKLNMVIIPAINKIDLKTVALEKIEIEIKKILDITSDQISLISAKQNIGVEDLLKRVINEIPSPIGDKNKPLKALIFDAYYDKFQGATISIRLIDGSLKKKEKIKFISNNKIYEITNIWLKTPEFIEINELNAGEVGVIQGNIKNLDEVKIGDTITTAVDGTNEALPGFQKLKPVVFANFFTNDNQDYKELEKALNKIRLNDSSFVFKKTSTTAFGNGFHCGFLGLLHLEIIQERIIREYNLNVITTTPSVKYNFINTKNIKLENKNLNQIKDWEKIKEIEEPISKVQILTPIFCLGNVMELIKIKRGKNVLEKFISNEDILISVNIPLAEIIIDFFDKLKSISHGYASFDYEITHYEKNKLSKLEILINSKIVEAFSRIVPNENAYKIGKEVCEKLKKLIPKENFKISIQAAINGKIIARENISALRKAVADKCYGGDISRKRKLWDKQKEGKKRMKKFGNVIIPQKIFLEILKN